MIAAAIGLEAGTSPVVIWRRHFLRLSPGCAARRWRCCRRRTWHVARGTSHVARRTSHVRTSHSAIRVPPLARLTMTCGSRCVRSA